MSEHHVVPLKVYIAVFVALLVLTVVTVTVSQRDFGILNDFIMLTIAVTKGVLVVLFFMHVAHSTRLTKLVVASGFGWLLVLFAFTIADYLSRGAIGVPGR